MKKMLLVLFFLVSCTAMAQQREKMISVAITNQHTAFPFTAFGNLFTKPFHPGVEAGYGFNWRTRNKHDFFQWFKAGYFYHRFVQHAIPLYTQLGYRYKFSSKIGFHTALGAGYQHSITAASVFDKNENGDYEPANGRGRSQVIFSITMGPEYTLTWMNRTLTIFLDYQQRLQAPFIRSYVPLLPYNQISIGASAQLKLRKP